MVSEFESDAIPQMDIALRTIVQEMALLLSGKLNPSIVLYLIDYYKTCSMDLLRDPESSKSRALYASVLKLYSSRYTQDIRNLERLRINIPVYTTIFNTKFVSPATNICKRISGKVNNNVMLFSHMPFEYHIKNYVNELCVLQSHTGKILHPHEFRNNVLGKYGDKLPFTYGTHYFLGDSKLIRPRIGVKQKRELIELATKHKWLAKSDTQIDNALSSIYKEKIKL
jgi:hypothetical protein